MKLAALISLTTLLTPGISHASPPVVSLPLQGIAQEPAWLPIAIVKQATFPMTVELVNETGATLEYGFTDNPLSTVPNTLPISGKATLVLTDPEINISISYKSTLPNSELGQFKFAATPLSKNSVQLIIRQTGEPDRQGDAIGQVVNIQKTGGIFIY
ncbi:MAG: hypothetical protein HC866_01915 [Leptolyngbyaceae cyanobacterium RU_5_1]|nr:hypothetical protein [Leptolyngbyaceae cyanobacterium RU_5_1]